MNKKAYLAPETNTINIVANATILAGSGNNLSDNLSGFSFDDATDSQGGMSAGSRQHSLWDDDED